LDEVYNTVATLSLALRLLAHSDYPLLRTHAHSYLTWLEEQKPIKIRPYKDALQKSIVYFAKQPHYNADIRLASIYIKSVSTFAFQVHSTCKL